MGQKLVCYRCKKEYLPKMLYDCPNCGGILEVVRDRSRNDKAIVLDGSPHFAQGIWKYFDMLPVQSPTNVVSIGEGATPLLEVNRITEKWHCDISLYIKAESLNPTGSFKDRPSSVGISAAKEMGLDTVVVSSSGNAGASVAAYAARGGMRCVVILPESTDMSKIIQTKSYGAQLIGVKGHFSDCFDLAKKLSEHFGWANLVSTFLNPYTVEGNKTIAYELFSQLKGDVPDFIIVPIGTGPLLAGIQKGYQELFDLGLITKLPAMVGVQVSQCEPITRAFNSGTPVRAWEKPIASIAGGISDPLVGYEKDGDLTVSLVRKSRGTMISLDEGEVLEATRLIECNTGLYSEPTGAVSVGAVKKLYEDGFIKKGSLVVSLLTGNGYKFSKRSCPDVTVVESFAQACNLF